VTQKHPHLIKVSGISVTELNKRLPDLTPKVIAEALIELARDQAKLVSKVGHDLKLNEPLYAVSWVAAFQSLQATLCERIIAGSYGSPHFAQVVRVLRAKGYLDELELSKLCLLPQKNTRSVVNRLVADGLVKLQEMPNKGGH
jgi:hypothetical protein